MEIIDTIDQLSPEWNALRIGSIGGSSISDVVAQERDSTKKSGKTGVRKKLLYRFVGEILSGQKYQGYASHDMKEGAEYETEARGYYSLITGVEVRQVALIKDGPHKHVSPDGLIADVGMVEIKTAIPSIFVETKDTGSIATDRRRQMQWGLKRSGRQWCDYVMYCPYLKGDYDPMIVIRLERDEKEIEFLEAGADEFIKDMISLFLRVNK